MKSYQDYKGNNMIKWAITRNVLEEEDVIIKSSNFPNEEISDLPHKFKLYDDDDELYFEGSSDDQDSEEAFGPLDWAMDDSGCAYIKYQNNDTKEWIIL